MKLLESSPKSAEIESRLTKYTFLSRNNLPGYLDGVIFQALKKCQKYPDRSSNPNFYHWYILLRQFATSAIKKWVEDRLYYDPNDTITQNFINQQAHQPTATTILAAGHPSSRQQTANIAKSPKGESGMEVQYEIDILLKENSESTIDALKRSLQSYKLEIFVSREPKQVKIKCGSQSSKCQQIADLISKNLQYENLQVKKDKKIKSSFRQEIQKE